MITFQFANDALQSESFSELSNKVSRTVASLHEWHNLHYIGLFIDLPDEQKAIVEEVAARTRAVLAMWDVNLPEGLT